MLVRPHIAFPDQFPPNFKQVALYNDKGHLQIDEANWTTITDAMALVVSPMGTAGSAHINGVDFAGKTGSAQTISNQLKAKMSAKEKGEYKDNGWFVGVTPRRNPQIVVACLFEGGEHGALAARVAAKVIAAYVEKQRRVQTNVAKANGAARQQASRSRCRVALRRRAESRQAAGGTLQRSDERNREAGRGRPWRGARREAATLLRSASYRVAHRDGST